MKFEPPIAEIERFPLKDIISASNGDTDEDIPVETTRDPNLDSILDTSCDFNAFIQNEDWEACL